MPEPQQYIGLAKEVVTYLVHAWGNGLLTTSGVQYDSTGASATEAKVFSTTDNTTPLQVKQVTIQPVAGTKPPDFAYNSTVLELEFALTAAFRTTSASGTIATYKWQAKEHDLSSTCWVDLTSWNTTAPGTTFVDTVCSGYFNVQTNLEKIPIDIRLMVYDGQAATTNQLQAKTKNSSYAKIIYRVT